MMLTTSAKFLKRQFPKEANILDIIESVPIFRLEEVFPMSVKLAKETVSVNSDILLRKEIASNLEYWRDKGLEYINKTHVDYPKQITKEKMEML